MKKRIPKELVRLLEHLDGDQLHSVYTLVVERLKLFYRAQALLAMRNFNVMDRVSFIHNGRYYEGNINRLNQKSITVILDDGNRWNISPDVLTKVVGGKNPPEIIMTKN